MFGDVSFFNQSLALFFYPFYILEGRKITSQAMGRASKLITNNKESLILLLVKMRTIDRERRNERYYNILGDW